MKMNIKQNYYYSSHSLYTCACVSDLVDGGLKVKHSQLQNVDEVAWLQALEIRIFLQLCEALAANKVYTLLQKLLKSIRLSCKKTHTKSNNF